MEGEEGGCAGNMIFIFTFLGDYLDISLHETPHTIYIYTYSYPFQVTKQATTFPFSLSLFIHEDISYILCMNTRS